MTNHTFPRTPFATPLARPGAATAQRIRRIVRFPKMKRTPAVLLVLAALAVLLCGNLAACQSGETPPPSGTGLKGSAENQTPPTDMLPPPTETLPPPREDAYQGSGALVASVPLNVAGGRTVTVELYGASARPEDPDWSNYYAIDELQVWEKTELLQTIRTAELAYDGDCLFEGLFDDQSGGPVGQPDCQDINFDGSQDLGLLAAEGYPHNVPYCYLLWDEAANQLSIQPLMLFGPVTLDMENQRIEEYEKDGPFSYHNYYRFTADGKLEALGSEPVQSDQPVQPPQPPEAPQPVQLSAQWKEFTPEKIWTQCEGFCMVTILHG